jgi:hypothetical protein
LEVDFCAHAGDVSASFEDLFEPQLHFLLHIELL